MYRLAVFQILNTAFQKKNISLSYIYSYQFNKINQCAKFVTGKKIEYLLCGNSTDKHIQKVKSILRNRITLWYVQVSN